MKKILLYLLLAACSLGVQAQADDLIIQGTVSNAYTGNPLGGWPVTINGVGITSTVITNSIGEYTDTIIGGSLIGPNQLFTVITLNCDSSTLIQTVSNNQGTVDLATVDFEILCDTNSTCSAPIYMTIMNGNTYRFYTDTVPGIQSYAWYVTTFQADTATSSASYSATPSAYFAGSTFNSPDYVEACLTITFSNGCTASACDTFIYCDAGFTYTIDNQYGLTLTPDFPAGYTNELHYWTVNGPGIPNPTQNAEVATYYVTPGASYTVCQQLMITSTGCIANECQVVAIPNTEEPVCDASFTYYFQPTNNYLNVSTPYTNAQGSFQHAWTVTSFMNDGTVNNFNQLNVNNNSLFVAANTNAIEICHTLTNLNTGCVDSTCEYLNFCSAEFSYDIPSGLNNVMFLNAEGIQTLGEHLWTVTYHGEGGTGGTENLTGPYATYLIPEGALDLTICHVVNNNGPYFNCSSYVCDTVVFCNADFTVIDNGNGTAGIWAVSPPIEGAVYTWNITGPGYPGTAYSGSYFNFTPVPNEPYYVCMAYFNAETGCVANNCDTVVVEGISDSCSAAFTYTYINNVVYAEASTPYISGNEYSYTVQSSVYGTIANTVSSGPQATFTLPQNPGIVTMCMNLTNAFNGCNESFCDTLELPTDTTCTADIVLGYAPDGWPMFSANASSEIATYTWILTPYDNNGQAVGSGFYSTQSNAYIPSGTAYAYIEACLTLNFASGCVWNNCATFTAPPDTGNTLPCNALFTFTGPLPVDNNYHFIGVTNDASANHYWTFGDGTSSTLESPFHAFETSGTYTVCHTVDIEGICSDSTCFTANFIGNSTTGLFIAGEVNAGANVPDNGKVKLYAIDTLSNSVSLVAEYILNNSGNYLFNGLEAGTYLIKAGLVQGSAWYGDYVPTYFGSQFYWFDAEPVYLTQSGDNYDISLIYAGNGGGPGSVGGNIDDGPFRLMDPESAGVANANPVAGADVIVTNLSGTPQRWMDADDNGNFNISNLAYGTYRLWADEPGMTCVPIEFTISPDFPYVFIELVMGDELTGTEALNSSVQIGNVYPNPTANQALIKINGMPKETIILDVMGLDGRLYQREMLSLQNQSIDIDQLPSGIYQLRIRNTSGSVLSVQKLSVIK